MVSSLLTKALLRLGLLVAVCGVGLIFPHPALAAGTFTYPEIRVKIEVNKDSTFDVTEKLTYRFLGEFRGVFTKIKLADPARDAECARRQVACGGIGRIALLGVYDGTGKQLDPSEYELATETDEDTEESYFTIRRTVWPGGKQFGGSEAEYFVFEYKYRLYGTIGWIQNRPYLYWNALGETRGGRADKGRVQIVLPSFADEDVLEVFADDITYSVDSVGKTINIDMTDIPATGYLTVAYDLTNQGIVAPGNLQFNANLPWYGLGVKVDGVDLGTGLDGFVEGIPAGKRKIEFYRSGYKSQTSELTFTHNQTTSVQVSLDPEVVTAGLIGLDVVLNVLGLIGIPFFLVLTYLRWRARGRDQQMPATIIPIFSPPQGVRPYLLGSVKDEKVDFPDITGSIIDLAYRGFIKIKEITPKKNYQLTKLEPTRPKQDLNAWEQELMDAVFGSSTQVETKSLGVNFLAKVQKLKTAIYKEMVTAGYFKTSPDKVRNTYAGIGVALLILGVGLFIVSIIVGVELIGVIGPVGLGVAVAVYGIANIAVANYMPAKTPAGSKLLAEILGFRMYLYTAERYRLQNLEPEEFEKYLSFAVVFGIEKQWAEKFKDIYKGQPEWIESSSSNTLWDVYWISSFSHNFSQSVVTNLIASGTGSAKGSGWSGGGSFGGFSGGGGGGSSSGAF